MKILIGITGYKAAGKSLFRTLATRLFPVAALDVEELVREVTTGWGLPLNDRKFYPLYAKCAELGVPVSMQVGHSAEHMPNECGRPIHLDVGGELKRRAGVFAVAVRVTRGHEEVGVAVVVEIGHRDGLAARDREEFLLNRFEGLFGAGLRAIEDRREHFVATTQTRDQVWEVALPIWRPSSTTATESPGIPNSSLSASR